MVVYETKEEESWAKNFYSMMISTIKKKDLRSYEFLMNHLNNANFHVTWLNMQYANIA